MSDPERPQLVWDWPLRLFHWVLAVTVALSLYTGLTGGFELMDWHQRSGFVVLALLAFRLLWGLVGSHHSRFASFLRGPAAVLSWVRAALRGAPPVAAGHNPLAGWMILLLLLALTVQGVTGLFATDDLFVEGPLVWLVDGDTASLMTGVHSWGPWTVGGLAGLHLLAIAVHRLWFREPLIAPMITGRRRGLAPGAGIESQRSLAAIACLALAAGLVWLVVTWS